MCTSMCTGRSSPLASLPYVPSIQRTDCTAFRRDLVRHDSKPGMQIATIGFECSGDREQSSSYLRSRAFSPQRLCGCLSLAHYTWRGRVLSKQLVSTATEVPCAALSLTGSSYAA